MLEKINLPKDLKNLKINELEQLSDEIRKMIIDTVTKTGGHLASSLGCVEIIIALHYVFDTPKDKIIYDVGHQTYAHKIITGRKDRFHTLRQQGGLSGFPKRHESQYDTFDTGHSGTSISLGLGLITGLRLLNENNKVIVVIGDGTLTTGMAYEALNNTGNLKKNLIIVLNDNEMSISKSIGAISNYLNRIITTKTFYKTKKLLTQILLAIPILGPTSVYALNKTEELIKGLIEPGLIFEELGFKYIGPIHGHNLKLLIKFFQRIKKIEEERPIIIHVVTKKGKGVKEAEEDPISYHGIGKKLEYEISEKGISYSEILGKTLSELAEKDKKIIAITAAMSEGTGLSFFEKKFKERFFDVGIAEQHAVGFAAGIAAAKFKPAVAIYSTFLQRAYDQIIHDVALQNLPVRFFIDRAGIVGEDGETHQGSFDLSYLQLIPNLVIMSPKDLQEFKDMIYTAMNYEKSPIAVRYPREIVYETKLKDGFNYIPIGKLEILKKGKDILIFAIGSTVKIALETAIKLNAKNILPTVVNLRFVKPIDEKNIITLCKKIKNVIVIEENTSIGGVGSTIASLLVKNKIETNFKHIALPDKFIEHGSIKYLREKYGISIDNLYKCALKLMKLSDNS